jgi:membrane protein
VLIALVALVLLSLAMLEVLGVQNSVWTSSIRRFIQERFTIDTFLAIDATVARIFESGSLALLLFAGLLALWEVSGAVRAMSGVLNAIYSADEHRSIWVRFGTSFWLAACVIVAALGALLAVALMPRVPEIPYVAGRLAGFAVAVVLLSAAIWLLLRFAPSRSRPAGWISAGSTLIVVGWIGASLLFGYYVRDVADYTSATGNLTAVLTLSGYLYVSSIVFLTGTQIDELLRVQRERGLRGIDVLLQLPGRGPGDSRPDSPG